MFPFNMPAGEYWLIIYIAMAVVVFWSGKLVIRWAVSLAPVASQGAQLPTDPRRFYRVGEVAPHRRLTIGFLPRGDEHLAIAYLRAGKRGVAEALLSSAVSSGWVYFWQGSYQRAAHVPPMDTMLGRFVGTIPLGPQAPATLVASARSHAALLERQVAAELEQAGLLADDRMRRIARWVRYGTLLCVMGLGGLRLWERPPHGMPWLLLFAMGLAGTLGSSANARSVRAARAANANLPRVQLAQRA